MRGKFIVFEGIDGSGKSTQCKLLSKYLTRQDIPHVATREPSDDPVGLLIRRILKKEFPYENESIALLYAANRYQHTATVIKPALARGQYVLCDRYFYSSMAYQGIDSAALYNQKVISGNVPDITFFIDVPPEECQARMAQSREGVELYESLEELRQEREWYMEAFKRLPEGIVFIRAQGLSPDEVFDKVKREFHLSL